MFAIFDFDDTLALTTREVIPNKLRLLLQAALLWQSDASVELQSRVEQILSQPQVPPHYMQIVTEDLPLEIQEKIRLWMESSCPEGLQVPLVPGALEVLRELKKKGWTLFLVTAGEPAYQEFKIRASGLEPELFDRMAVCPRGSKGFVYKEILESFQERYGAPERVLVCGDKWADDLEPARELGWLTVHVATGRQALPAGVSADVCVQSVAELLECF